VFTPFWLAGSALGDPPKPCRAPKHLTGVSGLITAIPLESHAARTGKRRRRTRQEYPARSSITRPAASRASQPMPGYGRVADVTLGSARYAASRCLATVRVFLDLGSATLADRFAESHCDAFRSSLSKRFSLALDAKTVSPFRFLGDHIAALVIAEGFLEQAEVIEFVLADA